jgi:hypothetical protein
MGNQISVFIDGYYPKTAILPLCSIYRHGGHDGWLAGSLELS